MRKKFFCAVISVFLFVTILLIGCDEKKRRDARILLGGIAGSLSQSPLFQKDMPFHKRYKWNAEDFFNDPQIIVLCKAIEAQDLREIDRLIAGGTDVNALGKDNMTPLLWAFPTQNLAVFTKILEAGADPNVQITSDFGVNLGNDTRIETGTSVMELVASTIHTGFFEAVMRHGGDPNLVSKVSGMPDAPLNSIAKHWDSQSRVGRIEHARLLLNAGADINAVSCHGTPIITAVQNRQIDLAIFLLEAGADWENEPETLEFVTREGIHYTRKPPTLLQEVANLEENLPPHWTDVQRGTFDKLVMLLKEKGAGPELDRLREENEQARQIRSEIDAQRARSTQTHH